MFFYSFSESILPILLILIDENEEGVYNIKNITDDSPGKR